RGFYSATHRVRARSPRKSAAFSAGRKSPASTTGMPRPVASRPGGESPTDRRVTVELLAAVIMSKRNEKVATRGGKDPRPKDAGQTTLYNHACEMAGRRELDEARRIYNRLSAGSDSRLKALVSSDLAAIAALANDSTGAVRGCRHALALNPQCRPASF